MNPPSLFSFLDRVELKLNDKFVFCNLVLGTIPVTSLFPSENLKLVPPTERDTETELEIFTPTLYSFSISFLGATQGTGFK